MTRQSVIAERRFPWVWLMTVSVAPLLGGCMMPITSGSGRSTAGTSPPRSPATTPAAAEARTDAQVTVNGETVQAADLWQGLEQELSKQAAALSPAEYATYVNQKAARLITDKIAEMLLYQRATLRLGSEVTDSVNQIVDRETRRIVTSEHEGIQRRYEKALALRGLTIDDVRARLRREIIVAGFLEREIKPKVAEPTRADLLAQYEAIADSLRRPERRSMSLIDVRMRGRADGAVKRPTQEKSQHTRTSARARIETARVELRSGASFSDVARRHSDGLHAADGGAWGPVSLGTVRERFEPAVKALYGLAAGGVSDILETDDGFFLVRCDGIEPAVEPDFQSLQPELMDRHFRVAYNRLISGLVEELRGKARIEPADLGRFHAAVVGACR